MSLLNFLTINYMKFITPTSMKKREKNYLAITRSLACEKIAADNSEQIYSIVDQYIKCIDLIKKK